MTGGRSNDRRRRLAWLALLAIALVIRLAWGLSRPVDDRAIEALPDQREYLQLGRNLLTRGSLEFVDPRFNQTVHAFRMPGYPLLVAVCGGNVRVVRCVQAMIDTATVGAAGLLAMSVFGSETAALAAAVIVAVNPFLIYFSGLVLSDTLYTAMFTWAILLLQRRRFYAGALVLALGVLVRPSGLMPTILLPLLAALLLDRSLRSAVRAALVAGVLLGLTLTPWAIRNHRVVHRWMFTTTNTGFTLYDGFHDGATGASDQSFVATMPELQKADEVGRSVLLQRKAIGWIKANPGRSLRLTVAKLARFWSPVPLSAEFNRRAYVIVGGAYAVVDVLAIVAIVKWRRRSLFFAFGLATCIVFSAMHAFSVGSLRYRMPLEPIVAVMASAALISRADRSARVQRTIA